MQKKIVKLQKFVCKKMSKILFKKKQTKRRNEKKDAKKAGGVLKII